MVAVGDRLWALATGWSGKPGESQETVESIGLGETEWRQEKPLPAREAETGWCSGAAACCVGTTIYLLAEPVPPTTACTSNVCRCPSTSLSTCPLRLPLQGFIGLDTATGQRPPRPEDLAP